MNCHNGRLPAPPAKMALKFQIAHADIYFMENRVLTRRAFMIQWIGVLIAVIGFAYNGVKDYQKGEIKIPSLQTEQTVLTKPIYPVQYCLMAYDPNVDKVFYQHENGQWYDYAPRQRLYATTTEVRKQY